MFFSNNAVLIHRFIEIFEDAGYACEIQSMTSCFILSKDKENEDNDILIFHETVFSAPLNNCLCGTKFLGSY